MSFGEVCYRFNFQNLLFIVAQQQSLKNLIYKNKTNILTHLAYIANVKNLCYMKQQNSGSDIKPKACTEVISCQKNIIYINNMKLKTSNVFYSFIVCSNRYRSALVHDLLSYNSLFVGQLCKDKSLSLRALLYN